MSCPVCLNPSTIPALTGTDTLFQTTPKQFELHACRSCDCLFLNPLPAHEEIAAFYPAQYWWSSSRPTVLKRLESIYRKIALSDHIAFITAAASRLPDDVVRLLDVGCGSGTLIGLLKRRGFNVLGVDTSEEASHVAQIENDVAVVVGTLEQAGFEERRFAMVTLFHVMEHVTNPRRVLAEVVRVLQPNGIVILQVPNIDSWQFRWFGAKWYGLDIPRHVIDYSRNAIIRLLSDAGFSVRRVRQFNLRDNAPALISSMFPSLDPLSRPIRLRRLNAREPVPLAWTKHLIYLGLVILAYPVAILEAAFGHGATVMIEAHKK